jgi:hypothetical protein
MFFVTKIVPSVALVSFVPQKLPIVLLNKFREHLQKNLRVKILKI